MINKQSIAICLILLLSSFAAYADETFYQIKMSGRTIGYTRYKLILENDTVTIQTTVLFTLGNDELNQEIKLIADTRLHPQIRVPIAYHLSTYINGYTQSTINTAFENHVAKQEILAGDQNFENEIELPTPTYIADDNFRIDHYNILLGQYDFDKGGTQSFHILSPLTVPQFPKAVELTLTWVGQDEIVIEDATGGVDQLKGTSGEKEMEFWYDRQTKRIVKWTIPSQDSEVLLVDDSVLPKDMSSTDVSAVLQRDKALPRIGIKQDLGNFSDLVSLQAHLDLHVVASGEPPIDLSYQKFAGEMSREGGTVHINGEVTVKLLKYPKARATRLPIRQANAHDPFIQPEPKIESEHPEIQTKAQEIVATAQTAYEATQAITEWVAQEIRYNPTVVSAYRCLSTQSGNAVSKSRLVAALLRSLNIPARMVGGLLYANNREFVQHHWVEAYIGLDAGWIAVDALGGEAEEFSAGHIALWRGMGRCATELGEMKIEILDFQSAAIAWQDMIPLQAGEQNRYLFTLDGEPIGDSTSQVKGILTYQGLRCYEIEATLNLSGNQIGQIDGTAKMYVTLRGRTLFYHLDTEIDGRRNSHEYIREGTRLSYTRTRGLIGENSKMWLDRDAYFIGNNMFWQWDLMFRKLELFTGMRRDISAFNPQSGVPDRFQIFVEDVDQIDLKGQQFHCFRVNVDGQFFWISSVGRLIRYKHPERKLVVELAVQDR